MPPCHSSAQQRGAVAVAVAGLLSLGPHELAVDAVRVEQLMESLKPFVPLDMKLVCLMDGLHAALIWATALIRATAALIWATALIRANAALIWANAALIWATALIWAAAATATALLLTWRLAPIAEDAVGCDTVSPIEIPIQVPCENGPPA